MTAENGKGGEKDCLMLPDSEVGRDQAPKFAQAASSSSHSHARVDSSRSRALPALPHFSCKNLVDSRPLLLEWIFLLCGLFMLSLAPLPGSEKPT